MKEIKFHRTIADTIIWKTEKPKIEGKQVNKTRTMYYHYTTLLSDENLAKLPPSPKVLKIEWFERYNWFESKEKKTQCSIEVIRATNGENEK